jgi:uncharacterized protein
MNEDDFEWDQAKAMANLRKHGISFADATRIFDDANALFLLDDAHRGEDRFTIIGYVNGQLLAVTYTERGSTVRLISARKATRHEQKTYHHQSQET